MASDALGELGETLRIARVEVRIGEPRLVRRDLPLQALDLSREPVEIALVLVGQLPCDLR